MKQPTLFTFLPLMALFSFTCQQQKEPQKTNVILMLVDDCSAMEFGCYGNPDVSTPNLERLGETGIQFNTAWATPVCSPSRAMFLTGRYAYRTKWYHNKMKPFGKEEYANLSKYNIIIPRIFKDQGYATAVVGKWQLQGTEEEYGFDEKCMWDAKSYEGSSFDGPIEPEEGNLPGRTARYWHPSVMINGERLDTDENDYGPDIFIDFIIDFAKRNQNRPFFVYYPMILTHETWDFDLFRMGNVAPPELDENGNKTGEKGEPSIKGTVEYLDHLVGRLVSSLDDLDLRENTVILFTTDNGTTGYGKGNMTQERGPRVPMILNCPGIIKPIGNSDALVDFSDVLPTMVDIIGETLPEDYEIDGQSFYPILTGEETRIRDWIFSNYAERRFLRDERWLLDGEGRFYDCGDLRNEEGYVDVTDSDDPEVSEARERFAEILKGMPAPAEDNPAYIKYMQSMKEKRVQEAEKAKAGRAKSY